MEPARAARDARGHVGSVPPPVTTARRIAGPNAKNRGVLLDAAERLLLTEGHAAVTSRRVAAAAGLKAQLVHYYFATMDDLLLAVLQRRAEQGLARQAEAMASERPVRAMWAALVDERGAALLMEFVALAEHREPLRAELARDADRFRQMLTEALTAAMARHRRRTTRRGTALPSPAATAVLLTGLAQILMLERSLGVATGHDEARAAVERILDELEPLRSR